MGDISIQLYLCHGQATWDAYEGMTIHHRWMVSDEWGNPIDGWLRFEGKSDKLKQIRLIKMVDL